MPASDETLAHWHHSVEGLSTSSLGFYTAIEEALKTKEAPVRTERIQLGENGALSAKRAYLRVVHDRFFFDIGAAPFGKDFFFSWWMGRRGLAFGAGMGCLVLIAVLIAVLFSYRIAGLQGGLLLFAMVFGGLFVYTQRGGKIGNVSMEDLMLVVPIIGPLYLRFFKPVTYYSEDTRKMFEATIHRVVLDVIAGILTVNSMRPLTPEETRATSGTVGR